MDGRDAYGFAEEPEWGSEEASAISLLRNTDNTRLVLGACYSAQLVDGDPGVGLGLGLGLGTYGMGGTLSGWIGLCLDLLT